MKLKTYKINGPNDYQESDRGGWVRVEDAREFALVLAGRAAYASACYWTDYLGGEFLDE